MPDSTLEPGAERLWVDIDSPQEVVATGLRHILETRFGGSVFMTVGPVDGEPDVILYDVIGLAAGDTSELDRLRQVTGSMVIAVSYDGLRPDLEALALKRGAAAVIPLSISAEQLDEVIRAAIEGHLDRHPDGAHPRRLDVSRPGSGSFPPGVGGLGLDRPGSEQSGDRRRVFPQCQLGEDLHPQCLSQDRCESSSPGRGVGPATRLCPAGALTPSFAIASEIGRHSSYPANALCRDPSAPPPDGTAFPEIAGGGSSGCPWRRSGEAGARPAITQRPLTGRWREPGSPSPPRHAQPGGNRRWRRPTNVRRVVPTGNWESRGPRGRGGRKLRPRSPIPPVR